MVNQNEFFLCFRLFSENKSFLNKNSFLNLFTRFIKKRKHQIFKKNVRLVAGVGQNLQHAGRNLTTAEKLTSKLEKISTLKTKKLAFFYKMNSISTKNCIKFLKPN